MPVGDPPMDRNLPQLIIGGVFGGANDAELQNQRAIAALGQPTASTVNTGAVTTVQQTTLAAFQSLLTGNYRIILLHR